MLALLKSMQYVIFIDLINFAEYSPGYEKWMVSPIILYLCNCVFP